MLEKLRVAVVEHFNARTLPCFSSKCVYFKIRAGAALSKDIVFDEVRDDVGENISDKNGLVNEITAVYWMWKHYAEIGDPDFVGLMHYRRQLEYKNEDVASNNIVVGLYSRELSVRDFFAKIHQVEDLDVFCDHLKHDVLCGADALLLDRFLAQNTMCPCNMFIMSREKFMEYGAFIAKCLQVEFGMMDRNEIDLERKVGFQKRVYGYILERMTAFWLFMQQEKKLCNLVIRPITVFPEYDCLPFWEQRLIDAKGLCRKLMWWRGR